MGKFIDLTGQKLGRLVVIKRAKNRGRRTCWLCRCMCGNECVVNADSLRREATQSCGCLNAETARKTRTIHGQSRKRLHNIWMSMRRRCASQKYHAYHLYGGRGIRVCDEWNDFVNFYQWAMANGYSEELTIDRVDINESYTPENCRWTSQHQQAANTRTNTDFPGVSFHKQTRGYMAYLRIGGKYVLHKYFKTKQEAIAARLEAEMKFGIVIKRKEGNNEQ